MTESPPEAKAKFSEQMSAMQEAAAKHLNPAFDAKAHHRAAINALQKYAKEGTADKNSIDKTLAELRESLSKLGGLESLPEGATAKLRAATEESVNAVGNKALAEGMMAKAAQEAAKAHNPIFNEDAVKALLGAHADKVMDYQPAQEAAKKAYGVQNPLTVGHAENIAKAAVAPEAGKSWTERLGQRITREAEMASSRWSHGMDARTGEKLEMGKAKAGFGVALAAGGAIDGARRIYVGFAGQENPETGKNERSAWSIGLGITEMAALVALGRKIATGQAFGR